MMSPSTDALRTRRLIPYRGRNIRKSKTGTKNSIFTHARLAMPMKIKAEKAAPNAISS